MDSSKSLDDQLQRLLHGDQPSGQDRLQGRIQVHKVSGRSTATSVFASYPLKFIVPKRVAENNIDAVWIYMLTYGGGILSGDLVTLSLDIADNCTVVMTTQASTKIYRSVNGKAAVQHLTAVIGDGALFALLPDPVTCFAEAAYEQVQNFRLTGKGASLVAVDWLTAGRRDRGEVWSFQKYSSTNRLSIGGQPHFIDKLLLEQGAGLSVAQRMGNCHVFATVILYGPRVSEVMRKMKDGVESLNQVGVRSSARRSGLGLLGLTASYSSLNDEEGLLVRLGGLNTESVYKFLQDHLALLQSQLGATPYSSIS
eukprot:SM000009S23465  [mRNA]  locus=s9:143298:145334:- [translate_table: standard]